MEKIRNLLKLGMKRIDLNLLAVAFGMFRTKFFTIQPRGEKIYTEVGSIEELRKALGRSGWHNDKELSYNYEGEQLNMATYYYDSAKEYPWRQAHIRAFPTDRDDVVELRPHDEPTPTDHPEAHYSGKEQSFDDGIAKVTEELQEAGYTVLTETDFKKLYTE